MTRATAALVLSLALAAAAHTVASAQSSCQNCVEARFWEVSPTYWSSTTDVPTTPERPALEKSRPFDVGVAFSGGGTRSASATIGQLRALDRNGWLSRVRYVTAVSGGSWAAVPFTYYPGSLRDLLGADGPLDPATIETVPAGLLATRVVNSRLGHVGLQEVPSFLPDAVGGIDIAQARSVLIKARSAIRRIRKQDVAEPDRRNKTYAHLIGQIFLDGVVPDGNRRLYAWDRQTAIEMSQASGRPAGDFIVPPADRPFLIVGGTLVKENGTDYPRLIPVEYTPLYTGIRQRFGLIGGTYLWPWAYDRLYVGPRSDTHVVVGPGPEERPFTLADVVASSGAAPQLELMLGDKVPERIRGVLRQASEAFPAFSNLAVRGGMPNPATSELAHGDGGFTDNLGIMPLLVRQVHNIIVFVNSSSLYPRNEQLQSYFMPLRLRDGNGDKSMNPVFEAERYQEVLDGFDKATATGGGAIYCGRNWRVTGSEIYNIRGYSGLNICWVYNYAGDNWKRALPDTIKSWVTPPDPTHLSAQARDLAHFPYYATFGENRGKVIQLKPLQVNLLADLGAWSISNKAAVDAILSAFDRDVLPPPATTRQLVTRTHVSADHPFTSVLISTPGEPRLMGAMTTLQEPTKRTHKVAIMNAVHDLPVLVARDRGFFRDEGLDIEFVTTPGMAQVTTSHTVKFDSVFDRPLDAAYNDGGIDQYRMCEWGIMKRAVEASCEGRRGRKIVALGASMSKFAIVTSRDSNIYAPEMLKNKDIAVTPNNGSHFTTLKMMEGFLAQEHVRTTNAGTMVKRLEALRDGRVAAVSLMEPWISVAQQQGLRILIESHSTRSEAASDELDGPALAAMFRAQARAVELLEKDPTPFIHYFVAETGGLLDAKDFQTWRLLHAPPQPYTRERFDDEYNWTVKWNMTVPGATYENTVDNRAWG